MPPDNIVIIGSSGHAKVIIDIVQKEGKYNIVGLIDSYRKAGEKTLGYEVLGDETSLPNLIITHRLQGALVAIGDNYIRSKLVSKVRELTPKLPFVCAVHPRANIATDASVGEGTVVMAGATINPCCSIGRFCILNTNSALDHDSIMADFSSLAPGATTGGNCRIGEYSAVCAGAVLIHGVHVGEHSVVGAASLVLKPIDSLVVAYGAPAKTIRSRVPGAKYL